MDVCVGEGGGEGALNYQATKMANTANTSSTFLPLSLKISYGYFNFVDGWNGLKL